MIPKIIHLCWLSGDAFPESIVNCLKTFPLYLADYEIYLWGKTPPDISCLGDMKVTEMHFDLDSTIWTKQAFEAKKYAFAADYIRLFALYTYGGIYLDADVVVYKSFDELLHLPYFIGCDQIRAFEAAVIGAEKGCQWIKDVLDTLQYRHFLMPNGTFERVPLPVRFHHVLTKLEYKFVRVDKIFETLVVDKKTIIVFSKDFFNSRNAIEVRRTDNSFCAHNYAGSWKSKEENKLKNKIKMLLPKQIVMLVYNLGQRTWAKNKYAYFQIPFEK